MKNILEKRKTSTVQRLKNQDIKNQNMGVSGTNSDGFTVNNKSRQHKAKTSIKQSALSLLVGAMALSYQSNVMADQFITDQNIVDTNLTDRYYTIVWEDLHINNSSIEVNANVLIFGGGFPYAFINNSQLKNTNANGVMFTSPYGINYGETFYAALNNSSAISAGYLVDKLGRPFELTAINGSYLESADLFDSTKIVNSGKDKPFLKIMLDGSTLKTGISETENSKVYLTLSNDSKLILSGGNTESALNTLSLSNSKVSFETNEFSKLNIASLEGDGTFKMRVSGMSGDFLNVDSFSGKFKVEIPDDGKEARMGSDGYQLIHASGSRNDSFALVNNTVDLGAYKYALEQNETDPDNWQLKRLGSEISESTKGGLSIANVTPTIWDSELTTLRARLGEIRDPALIDKNTGVWTKTTASRYNVSTAQVGYKQNTNGVVLGADHALALDNGQFLLGGMISYSKSDIDYRTAGDGTVDSYSAGLYGTYLLNNGYYVDSVLKVNQFKTKNNIRSGDGSRANGSTDTTGFGLSIEGGKHIKIEDYFVEPYVMLSVFRAEGTNYTLSNEFKTDVDATKSLKAEAGLTFGKTFTLGNGATVKPYARLAVNQEFEDSNNVTINNTERFNNDMSGTVGKVGLGMTAQLNDSWSAYAEVNYSKGSHIESPYNGYLGVRYSF